MSVHLRPLSAQGFTVGAANDPYKRYWWAILGGFILVGAWLCIPIMETPVGSVRVDAAKHVDAASAEQSFDSPDNPSGAPGGALDLSMDGTARKSKGGNDDMTSMLYEAPPEAGAAAAAGKPLGDARAASVASLAQQLKDAGKKADPSGWAEKAQRGFGAPHLSGGLSGAGSASGGSSASASAGGGGLFGSHNALVGFAAARGLHDDGSAGSPGFNALKASARAAGSPNLRGSDEAMSASMSQSFDGAKGKAPAQAGSGAMAQANAALAAAPANLKANDPKLDFKKLPDPPAAPMPPSSSGSNMGQQLVMMAATAIIGGMVGGIGGQMVMMMGSTMMQQQQQQQQADAEAKAKQDALNKQASRPS